MTISLLFSLSLISFLGAPFSKAATPDPSTFDTSKYSIDDPKSIWVVANKQRPLNPLKFVPKLAKPPFAHAKTHNPYSWTLNPEAGKAIVALAQAAKTAGAGDLVLQSAYRSYDYQTAIHAKDVKKFGLVAGEALAARPGYSEHQTGLAADVSAIGQGCQIRVCFAQTKMGKFVATNGWKFGFIVRYPSGATAITGYQFEPWHLRYVGVELATEMHNRKIAILENFFNLPAAPNY